MNWCKIFCWKHIFPGLENQGKNGWECTRACAGLCRSCLLPLSRYFPSGRCSWPAIWVNRSQTKNKIGKILFFLSFLVIPTVQTNLLSFCLGHFTLKLGLCCYRWPGPGLQSSIVTSSQNIFVPYHFSLSQKMLRDVSNTTMGQSLFPEEGVGEATLFFFHMDKSFAIWP